MALGWRRTNKSIHVLGKFLHPSFVTHQRTLKYIMFENCNYYYLFTNQLLYVPPFVVEDGSTANTAIFSPFSVKNFPRLSKKVDFPAPGGPDKPKRKYVSLHLCLHKY